MNQNDSTAKAADRPDLRVAESPKAASDGAGRAAIRNINLFLSADDHKVLKRHALETERSIQSVMTEALSDYFRRHGLGELTLVKAYRK